VAVIAMLAWAFVMMEISIIILATLFMFITVFRSIWPKILLVIIVITAIVIVWLAFKIQIGIYTYFFLIRTALHQSLITVPASLAFRP
jgi:hypothetical protein